MIQFDDQPTTGRKVHVIFDENRNYVSDPAIDYFRPANMMFRGAGANKAKLKYDMGWRVASVMEELSLAAETTITPLTSFLYPGNGLTTTTAILAKTISLVPDNAEYPGILTGASGSVSSNYTIFTKSISASGDWGDVDLSADKSAYPFAYDDYLLNEDVYSMDRIAVTEDNDSPEKGIVFSISGYGSSVSMVGEIARLYFCGPSGKLGKGEYCLVIRSSGSYSDLYEKLTDNTWKKVANLGNINPSFSSTGNMTIAITKSQCSPVNGTNGYITIRVWDGLIDEFIVSAVAFIEQYKDSAEQLADKKEGVFIYKINGPKGQPSHSVPIRVDLRRDVNANMSLAWYKWEASKPIEVKDHPIVIPFKPNESEEHPLTVTVHSCIPEGTAIDFTVKNYDTDTELTVVESDLDNKWKKVTLPTDCRKIQIHYSITISENASPRILGCRLERAALLFESDTTEFEPGDLDHPGSFVESMEINYDKDLSQESASFVIFDPLNTLDVLHTRASINVRIEIEYPIPDSEATERCVIFRGLMNRANRRILKPIQDSVVEGGSIYQCNCRGLAQILQENFVDSPYPSLTESDTGNPYKVTSLVKALIARSGFDEATSFDFPDLSTRIFATPLEYSQSLDMLDNVLDVISTYVRDYLLYFLVRDEVQGTNGKWKLAKIPVSPYTELATFKTGDITGLQHWPKDNEYQIRAGTYTSYVKPPEGNWLLVSSIGAWDENSYQIFKTLLINRKSYNVNGEPTADTSSPDYLGRRVPIYVIDPALNSGENDVQVSNAVRYLARRIAQLSFLGLKMVSFEAPFVLIDHETEVNKKRPLRYYDPILVDDQTFLIRSITLVVKKSAVMYSTYECEAPRF